MTDYAVYYTFDRFTSEPPGCTILYSYSSDASAAITFDPVNLKFTFEYSNDLSFSGPTSRSFEVQVQASTGTVNVIGTSRSFKITFQNPCGIPELAKV